MINVIKTPDINPFSGAMVKESRYIVAINEGEAPNSTIQRRTFFETSFPAFFNNI